MILGLHQTSQVFQISQIMCLASSDPSRRNGQVFKLDKGRGRNPAVGQVTQFRPIRGFGKRNGQFILELMDREE